MTIPIMSYLRYLCLFAYSGVQHILCNVFVLFVFVLCTLCCQFIWIVHFWLLIQHSLKFIYLIILIYTMYNMNNKKKYVLTCQTIDLNANLLNLVVKLPPAIQNVIFYKKKGFIETGVSVQKYTNLNRYISLNTHTLK